MHKNIVNNRLSPILALLLLLIFALLLRWLFFTGIINQADLISLERVSQSVTIFKNSALDFGTALQQARFELGGLRNFIFYIPNLLIYYVFGTTQLSSLVSPFVLSLANIYLVYAVTNLLINNGRAAIFAALFWAFFPLGVFYSNAAPSVVTLTFLFLLSIYAFLVAFRRAKTWGYGLALPAALTILLQDQWLFIALTIIIACIYFSDRFDGKWVYLPLGVTIGFILLLKWEGVGNAFLDFYFLILNQSEFVFLLPLFIVATAVILIQWPIESKLPLIWALAVLIGLIGKIMFMVLPAEIDLFNLGALLLPFFISFSMLIGIYFSKSLSRQQAVNWTSSLAFIGSLGAALAVLGGSEFLPPFNNFEWLGLHSLFLLYLIIAGVAFVGVLVSPYFMTSTRSPWQKKAKFVLLALIMFATFPYSWNRRNEYRYLIEAPASALSFIKELDESFPIYYLSEETNLQITFLANIDSINSGGDQNTIVPNLISVDQTSKIDEGLILVYDDELASLPKTWWRMGSFGSLGVPRISVYRVLSGENAYEAFLGAEEAVGEIAQRKNSYDLYGFLINQGLFCDAYTAWKYAVLDSTVMISTAPYNTGSDCLIRRGNLVDLSDLRKSRNIQGNATFPGSQTSLGEEPASLKIAQISLPIFDKRTVSVDVILQPNTLYLYSIELITPSPTATLFWRIRGQEDYLEMKSYPDWSSVAILMLTPDWESPQPVSFSPVLFDHLDVVNLRNFFFGPVELIETQN